MYPQPPEYGDKYIKYIIILITIIAIYLWCNSLGIFEI